MIGEVCHVEGCPCDDCAAAASKTEALTGTCADCAVAFAEDLLDDDGLCLWCELIRGGADPVFTADERKAEEWLQANPGLVLTDEWAEVEGSRQLKAMLRKCKTSADEYLLLVGMRRDGRCWDCQNRPLGVDLLGLPLKGVVVERNAKGLGRALELLEVDLRYNKRAHRAEMQHNANGWQPFNDRIVAKLRDVLAECFVYIGPPGKDGSEGEPKALKFGRESWADVLNVLLFDSEVDPFLEWLEGLEAWDKTERLDEWLPEVFTISERLPLAEWAGRFMVLGAVWRAYHPGLKLDEMPVLIGKGGLGKSTAARFLLPADRGEWFSMACTWPLIPRFGLRPYRVESWWKRRKCKAQRGPTWKASRRFSRAQTTAR